MELTLKRLLEQAEFTDARKGYDREQVDDFLDKAVAMATKVEARLTQVLDQSRPGAAQSGPTAAEVEAEVERRVQARLAEMPTPVPAMDAPSGPSEEETAEAVRRTLVLAQRTADAAVREAREDAAKLVSEAQERAARLNSEVEAAAAAARDGLTSQIQAEREAAHARLGGEIAELEGAREALRTDVTVLERHVEEQRSQLGSTVGELQRLLDDPAGFRLAPAPVLLDPQIPTFSPEAGSETSPEPESEPAAEAASEPGSQSAEPASAPAAEAAAEPVQDERPSESPAPVEQAAVVIDEPSAGPPELTFAEVDHAAPGTSGLADSGPPTAPVSAVELGFHPAPPADAQPAAQPAGEEDAFLTELRKAMADDEPLGPRDQVSASEAYGAAFSDAHDDDDDRRSWRFGKRR